MKQSSISARKTTADRFQVLYLKYIKSPECTQKMFFTEYLDRVSKGQIKIPLEKEDDNENHS